MRNSFYFKRERKKLEANVAKVTFFLNFFKIFATFKQKAVGIKRHENSKIKMSPKFKVANCWKGEKFI